MAPEHSEALQQLLLPCSGEGVLCFLSGQVSSRPLRVFPCKEKREIIRNAGEEVLFALIAVMGYSSRYSSLRQCSEVAHTGLAHSTFQAIHILGIANGTIW